MTAISPLERRESKARKLSLQYRAAPILEASGLGLVICSFELFFIIVLFYWKLRGQTSIAVNCMQLTLVATFTASLGTAQEKTAILLKIVIVESRAA